MKNSDVLPQHPSLVDPCYQNHRRQRARRRWWFLIRPGVMALALREAPFVAGLETRTVQEGVGVTLNEAFVAALDHTRRRPRSRRDWESSVVRFAKWLARNHPECA